MSEEEAPVQAVPDEPDYKVAARELEKFYGTLNLKHSCSLPTTEINTYESEYSGKHPVVGLRWILTFKSMNGKISEDFRYGMGEGHIKWNDLALTTSKAVAKPGRGFLVKSFSWGNAGASNVGLTEAQQNQFEIIKRGTHRGKQWVDYDAYADLCRKAAIAQGLEPKPWEVLGCVAQDGFGPYYEGETFEDWASAYGFDQDSRKAEKSYNECRDGIVRLGRLIDRHQIETLRDWSCQL